MGDAIEMNPDLARYRAFDKGAGLVDFSDRTLLELSGDDRASFLHNFCTSDIRKLPVGAGCESFVLNVQGKILGHLLVFCDPGSLVLETVPGEAARLLAHLDRYLIRERVAMSDRGHERAEWLLAGPRAADMLTRAGGDQLPPQNLGSLPASIGGHEVWLRRVALAGPEGFLVEGPRSAFADIGAALEAAGGVRCTWADWNVRRIEAGWPLYGVDISDKNLPQEVDRDRAAISFTKGCYLGQETVARIDALGHVNKTLVGARFSNTEVPIAGSELLSGDQVVGHVTSACHSPRLQAPLALAYVRRGQNAPGTKLVAAGGSAEVIRLPADEA